MCMPDVFGKKLLISAMALAGLLAGTAAHAETIDEALALAYSNNPSINAARAETRSIDENVAIAKSGYRPQVIGDAYYGRSWSETGGVSTDLKPGGFGIALSQTLFDSFKTLNDVEAARAGVYASRETLRNTVQNTLFDGASAYMAVIRDRAIAGYQEQALEFLNELVRSEQARFDVGESTRTDVAQAESQQAAARAQLSLANANLKTSIAIYRQVIGKDPARLQPPRGVVGLIPKHVDSALEIAYAEHPAILATKYLVDQADFQVKSAESDLLPTITLEGRVARDYERAVPDTVTDSASVTARLRVPIYQGGRVSAQVRQNKEVLGQRWIEVDQTVDQVRAATVSAYSQLEAAIAASESNRVQLRAANLALEGTVEERKVGQRTTLDVLNSQQDVINAQIALANAQNDIIVAGYGALSAIGRLDARRLGLAVQHYDPSDHYEVVKDKWFGLRTPDGR